ncbi:CD1375 family protein [Aerococcus urinaeequi]|uniref:CD1375 family protein n=1 Tax=Aerococcus urinaeequi TaxID=51665 RepID=UPI003D6B8FEB
MILVYLNLISKGLWSVEQIPALWKDDVIKALEEKGIPYKDITPEIAAENQVKFYESY